MLKALSPAGFIMANQQCDILQSLANQNDAVDFETMWGELSSSLREIHTKNASKLSFEELYRNAYKLVLKKKGETLYERVKQFEQEWLAFHVRTRIDGLVSPSLLTGHGGASGNTTVNEKRAAGERFLKALKQAWEDHILCMNMTTDVLMYMVRSQTRLSVRYQALPTSYQFSNWLGDYRIGSIAQITADRRSSLPPWAYFATMFYGHQFHWSKTSRLPLY